MAAPTVTWRRRETPEEAAAAACAWIAGLLRGREEPATVILAGGRTPVRLYGLLARASLPWDRLTLLPSDERCLPPGHPERNDTMLAGALLAGLSAPPAAFHPMPAERGAREAAAAFEEVVAGLPPLLVAILGVGEDGHTASLFPDDPALSSVRRVAPVLAAPKPPPERVTLTLRTLGEAEHVIFLVTGPGKREALAAWRAGEPLPAARVRPRRTVTVFADAAAAP